MRIAIFSLIEWRFLKQRPQVFATELAKLGHEVYYWEPFAFNRQPHRLLWEALKSTRIRESGERNIRLISSPYFWSARKYGKYFFMNRVLSKRIVRLLRNLEIDFAIVLDSEYALPVIESGVPHAFDHLDKTEYMEHVPTERFVRNMNRLEQTGAFNIYIHKEEAEEDPKGLYVTNGCYPQEFYPVDCPKKFDAVVIGSIAKWCDMASILESEKEILIVGPMDVDSGDNYEKFRGAAKSNLYYIPKVDKQVLNLWINSSCVGLVPFKEDDPVAQYAMPLKILEYFLCNVPVVSFRCGGIEYQYGDRLTYYSRQGNGPSLDKAIEIARRRSGEFDYRGFATQYAWPALVKRLEGRIAEVVKGRLTGAAHAAKKESLG